MGPAPQVYLSIGLKVEEHVSSICEGTYGECGHVVRCPYRGRLCSRKPTEKLEIDHQAIVDVPYDNRCRANKREYNGKRRDMLTMQPCSDGGEPAEEGYTKWECLVLDGEIEPGT